MSNPSKNWHWREKNVKPWASSWLDDQLQGLEAGDVSIDKITDCEGECTLGMRKSKLITIYDLKVTTRWQGPEVADGERITGTLTALEVSHDMSEEDYEFETTANQSGPEADRLKDQARTLLADKLRPIFQTLPKEMINTHGKDLLQDETPSNSGTSTPRTTASAPAINKASTTTTTSASASTATKGFNTTTVKVESAFVISASDLFELLTDEKKVPNWTRNAAQIKAEPGAPVSLFGGNITGKVISVNKPTEFVSTWRAPTWPEGYHGTLHMELSQGASDTTLTLRLEGVPLGKEEETEKNLDLYYIRSLKQIGYVEYPHLSSSSVNASSHGQDQTSYWKLQGMRLVSLVAPLVSFGLMAAVLVIALYYGPT